MMKKNFSFQENKPLSYWVDEVHTQKKNTTKGKTPSDYLTTYTHFKLFLIENGLDQINPNDFTDQMAGQYISVVRKKKTMVGKVIVNVTKNNYLVQIRGLFNVLIEMAIIDVNPFNRLKKSKVVKNAPKAYSTEQRDIIMNLLREQDIEMYRAACFLYYGFLRPGELMAVQVHHLNIKKRYFTLDRNVTKTGFDRVIRISDPLLHILLDMEISRYSPNHYLFGRLMKTSQERMPRSDYYSKRYARFVKRNDLPKSCKFYSWKHTGIQDHDAAGISIAQLSRQSGLTLDVLQVYLENRRFAAKDEFLTTAPYLCTIQKYLTTPLLLDKLLIEFNKLTAGQQKAFKKIIG